MEIHFDLSPIAPPERFEFWHDTGSLVQRPIKSAYLTPSQIEVRATLRPSNSVILGRMTASEQYYERTENMIRADHIDSMMLILLESGTIHWTVQGSEYHAHAGDLFLLDNHDISQSAWTAHQQIYAVIPRELVTGPGWRGPGQRVLRSASPCAAILSHYLQTIWESHQTASPNIMQQLAQGLASLTRLYFSETAPRLDTTSNPEPIKQTIQRWINNHLHNPDLDAALICSAFYLSRSTLYELFKPEGGIRTYLQKCRLERARLILESPDCQASISVIAQQLGFRSLSSFSRAFHDHWGLTPRDARKRALAKNKRREGETLASIHLQNQCQSKENLSRYYQAVEALSTGRVTLQPARE